MFILSYRAEIIESLVLRCVGKVELLLEPSSSSFASFSGTIKTISLPAGRYPLAHVSFSPGASLTRAGAMPMRLIVIHPDCRACSFSLHDAHAQNVSAASMVR